MCEPRSLPRECCPSPERSGTVTGRWKPGADTEEQTPEKEGGVQWESGLFCRWSRLGL